MPIGCPTASLLYKSSRVIPAQGSCNSTSREGVPCLEQHYRLRVTMHTNTKFHHIA